MGAMKSFFRTVLYRLRGEVTTEQLIKNGMSVGKNFSRQNGVILDPGHCWLITIGDNVTLAPGVHILCHDASTSRHLGYAKIGRVTVGNDVFIGAATVVLPNVRIGNNVIIGANSTVCCDIPDNTVYAGSPARQISTMEAYLEKMKAMMQHSPCFEEAYTVRGGIDDARKHEMKQALEHSAGFVR